MAENQDESCADLRERSALILRSPESGIAGPIQTTRQADSDDQLIDLWLHGRPDHTQRAYRAEADRFLRYVEKPLRSVKLIDLQAFADHLEEAGLKQSSIHRAMSAVKSLFAFGFRLGYLQFDVGRALKIPGFRDELAERILSEAEVLRIISLEPNPRNRAILLTLYAGGFRVSEICSLKWRHLQGRDSTGQITVFGKGEKTRTVLMPRSVWDTLQSLRGDSPDDAPVFRSRKKGHLDESQVWRIVTKAAERAGIDKGVSCHWFRHAHASHALDRGCPIHLVQATLGHSSVATTGKYLHARPTDSSGNYLPFWCSGPVPQGSRLSSDLHHTRQNGDRGTAWCCPPRISRDGSVMMNELRNLIAQYDAYYEMSDQHSTWQQGAAIDHRVRELAKQLRAEGHGPKVDALMAEHPGLISCPGGVHALA